MIDFIRNKENKIILSNSIVSSYILSYCVYKHVSYNLKLLLNIFLFFFFIGFWSYEKIFNN